MKSRLAINGFGRIGRTLLRAYASRPEARQQLDLVAINEIADAETVTHLARFDSTHGRYPGEICSAPESLLVDGQAVALSHEPEVAALPWRHLEVDLVLECTGAFSDRGTAERHLAAGARRMLFSQPAQPDVDATIVWGVNEGDLSPVHRILSAGSCTTNAISPVLSVILSEFGVEAGTITTIHSAMNDQPVLDAYHHTDLRKTRAAYNSIIPVDTGLAVGLQRILPALADKLTAHAIRVPTLNVSAMDLTVTTERPVSREAANAALLQAADGVLRGILGYTEAPLASCDFAQQSESGIVDASQTDVAADKLLRVLVWFDNEWAYAHRLLDIALALHRFDNPED